MDTDFDPLTWALAQPLLYVCVHVCVCVCVCVCLCALES